MDDSVFLIKVSNDEEVERIEEILNENDIIVYRKYKETGDYLKIHTAMTVYGVELYVSKKDLNKSKKLLNMDKDINKNDIGKKTSKRMNIKKLIPFLNR
ncbi:hypothetical protein GOQ29_09295 [Clostridium sp. D2Q-14]|uniref:hypothetical protein n=1 Tax=Anaeromonas gelatinilytica TaxID=2683194 RepID=UPI00193C28F7|nr:hypothetical protein [Anaeromonas gelatinilytica]MBS4535808.1 hypothetical protein [Anaeromonas gelatinilytica]